MKFEQLPVFDVRDDIQRYGKIAAMRLGPVAGQVEVTSQCFQRCRMCESWRDDLTGVQRGVFSVREMQDLCGALSVFPTFKHLSLTGGDPQTWPHLHEFMCMIESRKRSSLSPWGFNFQINTALTRDVYDAAKWRSVFSDVRVSIDGVTPETYRRQRGDKKTTPEQIRERLESLQHPRVQLLMCVTPDNVNEMIDLVDMFGDVPGLRKITFLPVIGERVDVSRNKSFWAEYESNAEHIEYMMPRADLCFSFTDSVSATRELLRRDPHEFDDVDDIGCWSGVVTFHIKANGDYYPCCLTGGEAVATHPEFIIGNIKNDSAASVIRRALHGDAHKRYAEPDSPCRTICQYKQCALNVAGQRASDDGEISMP